MRQHLVFWAVLAVSLAAGCGDDATPSASDAAATADTAGATDGQAEPDSAVLDGPGDATGAPDFVGSDDAADAQKDLTDGAADLADGLAGPCDNKADGTPCGDGDPCTSNTCQAGVCKAGANTCACQADGDCATKEDGDLCNGTLYCDKAAAPYVCKVNPASVVQCDSAAAKCQTTACNPKVGKCETTAQPDGTPCEDGAVCTQGDVCAAGACKPGENTCCTSNADCSKFNGADLCAGSWFCNKAAKKCQLNPVTVVVCPVVDDTVCSKNTCDNKTGKCGMVAVADKIACDDGNPCTSGDACAKGQCAASANTCTCQNDGDCAGKDDGNLCNGVPFCNKATGHCAPNPATVVVCQTAADGPCTVSTCQPTTGKCAAVPLPDGATCEADGSKCTVGDTCKAGACLAGTNTCLCADDSECAQFEDGDLCNGTLFCDKVSNSCTINPKTVIGCSGAFNTPCAHNLCEPKTGKCAVTAVNAGKPCDDGNVCTEGDVCEGTLCKAGANTCKCINDAECAAQEDGDLCNGTLFCNKSKAPFVCQVNPATVINCPSVDDSFCQKNSCVAKTGKCEVAYLHNDEACDDGTPCTVGEVCKQGKCAAPNLDLAKPCDDNNPCTDDSCSPTLGCVNAPNAATCTDNDACTTSDGCKLGACGAGKPLNCDDNNPCTTEVCNKLAGCVAFQNGELCDDGNACTGGESCKAGACQGGTPKDCSDNKPCTLDGCDKASGGCSSAVADAAKICDDGVACTIESCDAVKGCVNTPSAGPCDDNVGCTVDACEPGIGCTHSPDAAACSDKDACTQDVCAAAGCQHPANYDGAVCSDGDACTQGDTCKTGKCAPGPKSLACGAAATVCKGKTDGSACDDGDACTKDTTCQTQVCAPAAPVAYLHTLTGGPTAAGGLLDGPAAVAALVSPAGVAQDTAGNVWFTENTLHVVRRLDADGVVVTIAGMAGNWGASVGKGAVARFNQPMHLAIDGTDAIVADMSNHQIKRVAFDGTVTLVAGAGGAGGLAEGAATVAKFNSPRGVAVAKDGTIFVADTSNHRIRKVGQDGSVTTFVGSSAGKKDGTGPNALFVGPSALAWGPNGDLYVADTSNHAIRKVTMAGVVTTVAGGNGGGYGDGAALSAKFNEPYDMVVDASGLLLIADRANNRLRALGLDGKVFTLANSTACTHHPCVNGLPLVSGCDPCVAKVCAIEPACCAGSWTPSCVAKVGSTCGVAACSVSVPNDGKAAGALLVAPLGVGSVGPGRILVADTGNKRVRVLELRGHGCDDGNPCTTDSCDPATGQCATAPSAHCNDGNPCTVDSCDAQSGACAWKAEADGKACNDGQACALALQCAGGQCQPAVQVTTWSGKDVGKQDGPLLDARYNRPARAVSDGQGGFYVVETYNQCVRKIASNGLVTLFAGSAWVGNGYQDGPATVARFSYPTGIARDGAGNLYVADRNNSCIRKIAPDGTVSTLAGTTQQGSQDGIGKVARFKYPTDVVADVAGNLWVSDEGNHLIRAVSSAGVVTTVAGATTGGYEDGPLAVARFSSPRGLARDLMGNLYIADAGNHAVRVLTPAGIVRTFAGINAAGAQDGPLPYGMRLTEPTGLGVDAAGVVWVAEASSTAHRIRALIPGGRSYTIAGGPTKGSVDGVGPAALLASPTGVVPLVGGEVLIVGTEDHRLRKVKPAIAGCDDGNGCTADACLPKLGCQNIAQGDKACDDGNLCTTNDLCVAGTCKASAPVANCPCKAGPSGGCDDGNPCTIDSCSVPGGCATTPQPKATACDDGNPCTSATWCAAGQCVPQPAGDWVIEPFAGPEGGAVNGGAGLSDGARRHVGGTQAGAAFAQPSGLAMDGAGALWVADVNNHVIRRVDPDGNVRTPAGSLWPAGGHADGKAVLARFQQPDDVATDAAGNVYIADYGNHVIRKIDGAGNVTTLAGSPGKNGSADGKGAAATFNSPRGLVADLVGNVYVADTSNNRIRKVTPDGQVTTLAGAVAGFADGQGAAAAFSNPRDLAFLPDGSLAVTDNVNHAIRKVTLAGLVTTLAGGAGAGYQDGQGLLGARFSFPAGLVADSAGVLYIAEEGNLRVRRLDPDGTVSTIAGSGKIGTAPGGSALGPVFAKPRGIAIDSQGRLYVSDSANYRIVRLRQVGGSCDDGNPCTVDTCDKAAGCNYAPADPAKACAEGPACSAATCDAVSMRCVYAPAAEGSLCDSPGVCQKQCRGGSCMAAGLVTTFAGSEAGANDGPLATARFNTPHRVALANDGTIYVADTGNHRIRKIAVGGQVTTLAGSTTGYAEGKGSAAKFSWPMGVAVAADGSVLVADRDNHRIRKVTADGTVSTLAGSSLGLADGPGVLAKFSSPADVVVDAAGFAYVADSGNHRIRKIGQDGTVTSLNTAVGGGAIDGPASTAKMAVPLGLAVDGSGNVWIADTNNHLLRRLDAAGVLVTIAGHATGFANGSGRFGGRMAVPVAVALLPDGSMAVADKGNSLVRRVWPDGTTHTLAGGSPAGFAEGMGGDARFYYPHGIAVDKAGNLLVADSANHRIRKIFTQYSSCADLAGASKYAAGTSCKTIAAVAKWSGSPHYYVDPNGGSKVDAWKTTCDQSTDGGGWTRVDATMPASTVDQLRGAKGQMLLKCSDTAPTGIVSPVSGAPWSWTTKTAVAGDWAVAGKAVACGADPAFAAVSCGFGYGCSNGAADQAAFLLPGVVSGNQCANDKAAHTGTAFALCSGNANYGGYSVFVRGQ